MSMKRDRRVILPQCLGGAKPLVRTVMQSREKILLLKDPDIGSAVSPTPVTSSRKQEKRKGKEWV